MQLYFVVGSLVSQAARFWVIALNASRFVKYLYCQIDFKNLALTLDKISNNLRVFYPKVVFKQTAKPIPCNSEHLWSCPKNTTPYSYSNFN